jgi:FHS family L-fucose permease-like MFS transporter
MPNDPEIEMPVKAAPQGRLIPAGMATPFLLVTALFFLWGIPNNLNDVLIR